MRKVIAGGFALALLAAFVLTGSAVKPSKPGAALEVSMTASGHWTQTYDWTISKTVQTDQLLLTGGDPAVADYTITLAKSAPLDSYSVDGEVCVTNPGDRDTGQLTITSDVVYKVDGKGRSRTLTSVPVDMTVMATLPAGASYCYPYTVDFVPVAGATYTSQADVVATPTTGNKKGSSTAKTDFGLPGAPDTVINDSIDVADDGDLFVYLDTGSDTYQRFYATAGTFTNTATILQTGQFATATVTVSPVTCSTVWDAVAYWCFDDQTNPTSDGADGHDGDVVGPVFDTANIPAVPGNVAALRFDGDDYVWIGDPVGGENLDGFTSITLAAWINPDSLPTGPHEIVSKYGSGTTGVSWGLDTYGTELRFVYAGSEFASTGANLQPNLWTHVAGTWDGRDVRLYVNGQLISTGTNVFSTIADNITPVNIGSADANVGDARFAFFTGMIDEVFVFDRQLSQLDVVALGQVVPPPPPPPPAADCSTVWDAVAYWCFDDQVSPTMDGASVHDGIVGGPVFSSDTPASVTNNLASVSFDGVDDYITVADPGTPNDLDGFAGLTMSAWVKPDSVVDSQMIVTKYDTGPANSISYWFILRGDEVEIFVATQRPTEDRLTTSGADLVAGEWVHLTGTWDGAYLRIYVNGQMAAEKATSISVMDNSSVPVNIGAAEYVTSYGQRWFFFDGLIDEMYLFDRALTVTEIVDLASGAVK